MGNIIGKNIYSLRKKQGLTQEEIVGLVNVSLQSVSKWEKGIAFRSAHIMDKETAQNAPTPIANYALFKDGEYVTNEILSDKKFLKMING